MQVLRWLACAGFLLAVRGSSRAATPLPALPTNAACMLLPDATVSDLTGVLTEFVGHPRRIDGYHTRCSYNLQPPDYDGEKVKIADLILTVDLYRFATDSQADAATQQLGEVVPTSVLTDSPAGMDTIFSLRIRLRTKAVESEEFSARPGFAARHGRTVVLIEKPRSDEDDTRDWDVRVQKAALTAAGAHPVPWPTGDLCSRVPAAAVQTLVTLGPADVTSRQSSKGGQSTCIYEFTLDDSNGKASVEITTRRFLNTAELDAEFAPARLPPALVRTADSRDRVNADPDGEQASASHGLESATVKLSGAERDALEQASHQYHLQGIALRAAGADVGSTPGAPAIPPPAQRSAAAAWWRAFVDLFFAHFFRIMGPLVVGTLLWRWYRRRQLRLYGLRGTALVTGVGDTGITINNSPMVRFSVTITPEGGTPYQATQRKSVSRLQAPASLIGQTLNVRIDPRNPKRFMFV